MTDSGWNCSKSFSLLIPTIADVQRFHLHWLFAFNFMIYGSFFKLRMNVAFRIPYLKLLTIQVHFSVVHMKNPLSGNMRLHQAGPLSCLSEICLELVGRNTSKLLLCSRSSKACRWKRRKCGRPTVNQWLTQSAGRRWKSRPSTNASRNLRIRSVSSFFQYGVEGGKWTFEYDMSVVHTFLTDQCRPLPFEFRNNP